MELEVGKEYKLRYSGEFCHSANTKNTPIRILDDRSTIYATFIGKVEMQPGARNIFYTDKLDGATYIMFAADRMEYIVDEKEEKIIEVENKIRELQKELEQLRKNRKI